MFWGAQHRCCIGYLSGGHSSRPLVWPVGIDDGCRMKQGPDRLYRLECIQVRIRTVPNHVPRRILVCTIPFDNTWPCRRAASRHSRHERRACGAYHQIPRAFASPARPLSLHRPWRRRKNIGRLALKGGGGRLVPGPSKPYGSGEFTGSSSVRSAPFCHLYMNEPPNPKSPICPTHSPRSGR